MKVVLLLESIKFVGMVYPVTTYVFMSLNYDFRNFASRIFPAKSDLMLILDIKIS